MDLLDPSLTDIYIYKKENVSTIDHSKVVLLRSTPVKNVNKK